MIARLERAESEVHVRDVKMFARAKLSIARPLACLSLFCLSFLRTFRFSRGALGFPFGANRLPSADNNTQHERGGHGGCRRERQRVSANEFLKFVKRARGTR